MLVPTTGLALRSSKYHSERPLKFIFGEERNDKPILDLSDSRGYGQVKFSIDWNKLEYLPLAVEA